MSAENPQHNPFNGAPLVPGNPGNSGGKKGRSGRIPEEAKELCRELWSSPAALKSVRAILKNHDHPHFASIWRTLGERGYGKPEQPINHGAQAGSAFTFTMNLGTAAVADDS